jgi:dipeptidyl aminopeptidase/acylaminoacyl peptidase
MATPSLLRTGLLRTCPFAALLLSANTPGVRAEPTPGAPPEPSTAAALAEAPDARLITITYTTHDGRERNAYVQLPHDYRPGENPAIPLVVSPHGRGVDGLINTRRWGNLPTIGNFAVVNPDGYGRRLALNSWGYAGQIEDLARMAETVESKLPWVHLDHSRIYAVGGSMGAQETLLLAGRYPRLLAGAVAVDGPADFALQYRNFARLPCDEACLARGWGQVGLGRQGLARREIGGTPSTAQADYAARSPITYARAIAASCIPVQIWWSRKDKVVLDPADQSGRMFQVLRQMNPQAPIDEYVGDWDHTDAMRHEADLPKMLAGLGLLPPEFEVEHMGAGHTGIPAQERCNDAVVPQG